MSYIIREHIAEHQRRIEQKIAQANAEGRMLPLEGTVEDLAAATMQALRQMSEEQKAKLRERLLWQVYEPKLGGTIQ